MTLVPLEIYFTGDTPTVSGGSIEATLATRGRGLSQSIVCDLTRRGVLIQTQDCELGKIVISFTLGYYIATVYMYITSLLIDANCGDFH